MLVLIARNCIGRAPGLVTKVAVLPPMGEGHQPREELEKTKEAEVVKVHQAAHTSRGRR